MAKFRLKLAAFALLIPFFPLISSAQPAKISVDEFISKWKAGYTQHKNYGQAPEKSSGASILNGAKKQLLREIEYDYSYRKLKFPNGDPPPDKGVCTDVAVRAFREIGFDLQKAVYDDLKKNYPGKYPNLWGHTRPDTNIDHRRVPNLMVYFHRHANPLPLGITGEDLKTWAPGDVVFWELGGRRQHVGVVSDKKNSDGLPLAIHHWPGQSVAEEDVLDAWARLGHYRWPQPATETARTIPSEAK